MEDLSRSSRVTSLLRNHASPNIFDPATVAAMEGFYQEIHVFFDGINTLPGLAPPWIQLNNSGHVFFFSDSSQINHSFLSEKS
ncbi:hypothetical protein D1007_19129 [Hordeum vulgare]|nr:hypothetical protein D1007_19129 [Hordeum vulgare]